jgi:hypothetical protein
MAFLTINGVEYDCVADESSIDEETRIGQEGYTPSGNFRTTIGVLKLTQSHLLNELSLAQVNTLLALSATVRPCGGTAFLGSPRDCQVNVTGVTYKKDGLGELYDVRVKLQDA